MLFGDFYYLIFLGLIFFIYYSVGKKLRIPVLFVASVVFIGALSVKFLAFALVFSIINYFFGIILEKSREKKSRKTIFWIGIFLNVGILATFKYLDFLFENINAILSFLPSQPEIPYYNLIIPLGISYYTFQSLGYIIRINRGAEKAEKNIITFSSYLLFFPKFLSGPVERFILII